jgi:hypothetical protein
MANDSDPNVPVPTPVPTPAPTPAPNALDIQVLNNGVKLLGESLVPGASLLLEKHITAGVMLGALGVIGGAAFGRMFGPLGYVLARYGASAISFSQSVADPPPPTTTNGGVGSAPVVNEVREMRRDFAKVASALSRIAPPPPPAQPAAFAAAATSDLAEQIASALRSVVPEIATATSEAVGRSVRTVMRETGAPAARTRRAAAKA